MDAIHPGYGFLAENADFARACADAGIEFIGPTADMMEKMGDKVKSKLVAHSVGVPTIPGIEKVIETEEEALEAARICGFPVMLKAAAGGGGRGMRIVNSEEDVYKRQSLFTRHRVSVTRQRRRLKSTREDWQDPFMSSV